MQLDAGARSALCDPREREACGFSLLEAIAANVGDLILRFDRDGVLTYVSPSCASLGYVAQDVVGRHGFEMLHPEDHEKASRGHYAALADVPSEVTDRRLRVLRKDGAPVWFEGDPRPHRDHHGVITGSITILRDITERKALEDRLVEQERHYRLLADTVTDAILRIDINGITTYASPSIFDLTGYRPEEVIGRNPTALLIEGGIDRFPGLVADLQGTTVPLRSRYMVIRKDGGKVWAEGSPRLIRDERGAPLEVVTVVRDITAQVRSEEELRSARAEAETASAAKAQFLSNMSHEIRTPLTAVLGFSDLLRQTEGLPAAASEHIHRIISAGNGLMAIVNDVLDISKLEAGRFTIHPTPSAPRALCTETLEIFRSQAEQKSLRLTFTSEGLPAGVSVDAHRVRQILINLLGNAIKFTEAGAVSLATKWSDGWLELDVTDTGSGMDLAMQAALFGRFSQVGGPSERAKGGTGLGLAISRGLAEAMGGEIAVRSSPGFGSAFTVRLPAPAAEIVDTTAAGELPDLSEVRVLVVDDNEANRALALGLLSLVSADSTSASSGEEALALADEAPFDLALIDRRMPGLDGIATLERLRRSSGPNSVIPALLFTADFDADDEAAGSGFAGVIRKPIEPAVFFSKIAGALAGEECEECEGLDARVVA